MPFPLAHPAAVLPLRRLCPRWLNFPALVIGTLSPDASYLASRAQLSDVAHHWPAGLGFGMAAGLVMLLLSQVAWLALNPWLPAPFRNSPRRWSTRSVIAVLISLALGVSSHIWWDGCTHMDGWLAEHCVWLTTPVGSVWGYHLRPVYLLWYLSTIGGVGCVCVALENQLTPTRPGRAGSLWLRLGKVLPVMLLMLPIALAHHLVRQPGGDFLVVGMGSLLIAGFAWGVSAREGSAPKRKVGQPDSSSPSH